MTRQNQKSSTNCFVKCKAQDASKEKSKCSESANEDPCGAGFYCTYDDDISGKCELCPAPPPTNASESGSPSHPQQCSDEGLETQKGTYTGVNTPAGCYCAWPGAMSSAFFRVPSSAQVRGCGRVRMRVWKRTKVRIVEVAVLPFCFGICK